MTIYNDDDEHGKTVTTKLVVMSRVIQSNCAVAPKITRTRHNENIVTLNTLKNTISNRGYLTNNSRMTDTTQSNDKRRPVHEGRR